MSGGSPAPEQPADADYGPVALPSRGARIGAFAAVLVGGLAGWLIGVSVVNLQCEGDCSVPSGLGGIVGAIVAAIGVGIVAVLALRASVEWREVEARRDPSGGGQDPGTT